MEKKHQTKSTSADPFAFPSRVRESLRTFVQRQEGFDAERVRYLWMHLSGGGLRAETGDCEERQGLTVDEWLNVVDEAGALGVRSVIISSAAPLSDHPEIWDICDWAQNTHDMVVGIYLYGNGFPVSKEDLEAFERLEVGQTRLFVDGENLEKAEAIKSMGIPVYNADVFQSDHERSPCQLPHSMTCVGAEGNMYTCGLVLGEEGFRLGNVCERRLDAVMDDQSLPHEIPGDVEREPRRCNACPPLMEKYLRHGAPEQT